MNVLVLNGSPKGNESSTMRLTEAFLEGAGYNNAEIIDVSKLDVKYCLGCYACWMHTPGVCVITNDDMPKMLEKLIKADIVIWSFPLYYANVPGPLKTFIDRQLPMALPEMVESAEFGDHPDRYDFSKQRHMLISTCGYWTHEGNYSSITEMFTRNYRGENYGTLFAGQGGLFNLPNTPEVTGHAMFAPIKKMADEYINVVRRAGHEWAAGEIKAETKELLAKPLLPKEDYEKATNNQ